MFNLKEEIKKLEDSKRRDLNIIGLYLSKRNPNLENKEQFNIALKRHIRPARDLSCFNDEQILNAIDYAENKYKEIYTLETLLKILCK